MGASDRGNGAVAGSVVVRDGAAPAVPAPGHAAVEPPAPGENGASARRPGAGAAAVRGGLPRGARGRRTGWAALAAVVLVAIGLVALHVDTYRQLSVYDEPQHVDYVNHLLRGNIEVSGDRWTPETISAVTCRTVDYPTSLPPCGSGYDPGLFPNFGLTTAFVHTPAYYAGPAAAVLLGRGLGLPVDPVGLMRATGMGWLALALSLLWLLWRDQGIRRPMRAALALGLTSVPVVLLQVSTVTNDATALAAGAALTLAAMRWDAGRVRLWVPLVVAVAAMLLKSTNLGVLLLVAAFVLVRGLQRARAEGRFRFRTVVPAGSLGLIGGCALAAAVTGLGWAAVSSARAAFDPKLIAQNVMYAQDSFRPSWLWEALPAFLSPLRPQHYQSVMDTTAGAVVANAASVGLLVLAAVGALRAERGSALRALGLATALALLVYPLLLVVVNYATAGINVPMPARYGLSLVPALLVLSGGAVRSRTGQWVALGVGVAMAATSALVLLLPSV